MKEKGFLLITGGAGYIGSHTVKKALEKGYNVIIYDNLSTGHRELVAGGNLIVGDLEDENTLEEEVFAKFPINGVIHFAAFIEVAESVADPQKFYFNNLVNTLILLKIMLKYKVKNFIFSSSCAVYGRPQYLPIDERHPLSPINPYGNTKLAIENVLNDYKVAYGLNYVSLRYFNAAGADESGKIGEWHIKETHLVPLALETALGIREDIKIYGTDYSTPDGTCIRDYIHVNDLADAHLLALEAILEGHIEGEVFNLGVGKGWSVKAVISKVKEITGKDFKVIEAPRRSGDPPILIADNKKATTLLGWRPRYSLEEIIASAWQWHKKLRERG